MHIPACPVSYLSVSLQPSNASSNLSGSYLYAGSIDPAQWVGLRKTEGKLLDYLRVLFVLFSRILSYNILA